MSVSYDVFTSMFLEKVTEYSFLELQADESTEIIDGYMKRAIVGFKKNCVYDLTSTKDDENRLFNVDILEEDLDEIIDIISDGMIIEWMKPYVYNQDLLRNVLNTRDFTTYSPSGLSASVGSAYKAAQSDYIQKIREYSYNHGNLTELYS